MTALSRSSTRCNPVRNATAPSRLLTRRWTMRRHASRPRTRPASNRGAPSRRPTPCSARPTSWRVTLHSGRRSSRANQAPSSTPPCDPSQPRSVPEPDVEHTLISQGPHEIDGEPSDLRVVRAHAQAGGAALRRVLAQLATREAGNALGPLVEDPVEHPHGRVITWDVFLEHEI